MSTETGENAEERLRIDYTRASLASESKIEVSREDVADLLHQLENLRKERDELSAMLSHWCTYARHSHRILKASEKLLITVEEEEHADDSSSA